MKRAAPACHDIRSGLQPFAWHVEFEIIFFIRNQMASGERQGVQIRDALTRGVFNNLTVFIKRQAVHFAQRISRLQRLRKFDNRHFALAADHAVHIRKMAQRIPRRAGEMRPAHHDKRLRARLFCDLRQSKTLKSIFRRGGNADEVRLIRLEFSPQFIPRHA